MEAEDEVTLMEYVVDLVSDWGADIVSDLISKLSTNGRPFGQEVRTPEEQLIEYLPIRWDPNKLFQYMSEHLDNLMQELNQSGAQPEAIAAIHPADLILSMTVKWISDMEALISSEKYDIGKLGPPEPKEPIQFIPPIQPNLEPPKGYFPIAPKTTTPVSLM